MDKAPYIALLFLVFIGFGSAKAQKRAFALYNTKGKEVSYRKMLKALEQKDIVLFGELHNNPIAHWLELELAKDLHGLRKLSLGAEMLQADDQSIIDTYLKGELTAAGLDSLVALWPNHATDYAPLLDFAKAKGLPFIATNVPRRYARRVHRHGFGVLDSLSGEEKQWLPPLPIPFDSELPGYKRILSMMGDHGSPKLVMAQALRDATMAHFILKNHREKHLFLHFNGAYHSNHREGILWYLRQGKMELDCATISTVSQEEIEHLLPEHRGLADFILCVDADMTTTY